MNRKRKTDSKRKFHSQVKETIESVVGASLVAVTLSSLATLSSFFELLDEGKRLFDVLTSPIVITIIASAIFSGLGVIIFLQWQKSNTNAKQDLVTLKIKLQKAYRIEKYRPTALPAEGEKSP